MTYIKSIKIKEELNNYKFNSEEDVIRNISKISIFIGSNNSGKSRLLRNIYLDKKLKFNMGIKELDDYNELVESLNKEIEEVFKSTNITEIGNINIEEPLDKIEYIEENNKNKELFLNKMENLRKVNKTDNITSRGMSINPNIEGICEKLNSIQDKYIKEFNEKELDKFLAPRKFKRIYIPILRGLRKLGEGEDILHKRTINDYFKEENYIEVFTGQNLYNEVLGLLCGNFRDRNHLKEFETFLGENFFDGKIISLIPKIGSDVLFAKIGEEREQPIYDLGDGIQSIIILTFNLFANKGQDVLFFIEEPELYLHPGLQRKVIEIFLDNDFNTYQYFITSHSNHLLDLTLDINDISVYKFSKKINDGDEFERNAKFNIENVNNDDISVLELLGVNNSSIFLSNCTIWVEGITDRLYIRKYLEIYQKEKIHNKEIEKMYSEDLHYSFLEYSGGNITHWDFLNNDQVEEKPMKHDRICNKIFLIADSDGYDLDEGKKKSERLKSLENYFGDRFYCLKAKEIENILAPNIIKSVVNKFKDARCKGELDKDSSLFQESEFTIEDYRDKNIGKFIEEKIEEKIKEEKLKDKAFIYERRKKFASGNTINQKVRFCKCAIQDIKNISDISEDAIELCDKIYNFIKGNN